MLPSQYDTDPLYRCRATGVVMPSNEEMNEGRHLPPSRSRRAAAPPLPTVVCAAFPAAEGAAVVTSETSAGEPILVVVAAAAAAAAAGAGAVAAAAVAVVAVAVAVAAAAGVGEVGVSRS
eukprot:GHVU01071291.1.p2 GENE.GHVU01071291.1~~GHVU01071291.1.p2  ORF type:complete len:120 (-),score=31.57 GHVU01071291.1:479-838(-)